MNTFTEIYVLNLHGNSKKKEPVPDGVKDENVFDIKQGVAIGIFIKEPDKPTPAKVYHADLWGEHEAKIDWLASFDVGSTVWTEVAAQSPFYLFVPQDVDVEKEYNAYWRITEIMPVNVLGFQTHRDHFAVDFDRERLYQRIREMRESRISDQEYSQKYSLRDNRDWQLATARQNLRSLEDWESALIECSYRPFDNRWCYFSEIAADYPRRELKDHVAGRSNLCLNTVRQTKMMNWQHAIVSDKPAPAVYVEIKDGSNVFPLYLYPDPSAPPRLFHLSPWPEGSNGRTPNLDPEFVTNIEENLGLTFVSEGTGDLQTNFGPEDIFNYIYAVFYSPAYQSRYATFLKIDFPRVPLTRDKELFTALVRLGDQLVKLHVLEQVPNLPISYPVRGDDIIAKGHPKYNEAEQRVYINQTQYFGGIAPDVWEFYVGGYQVLEKWLKDRQGRHLSYDDLTHYRRIVAALSKTIELMDTIDDTIPSWPIL